MNSFLQWLDNPSIPLFPFLWSYFVYWNVWKVCLNGKGGKDRYTIIPPQVLDQLNNYISLLPADNPYVFQGQNNKHYSSRTPQQILNNAFKKLCWYKGKQFGCHAIRHSFTLWAVDDLRLDFDEVSKMLGHSVMRTTQIYTQCRRLNLKRAIEQCKEVSIII